MSLVGYCRVMSFLTSIQRSEARGIGADRSVDRRSTTRDSAVSVAALEPFGGALRGSPTAGVRLRTVESRCRLHWQSGGLSSTLDHVEAVRRVPQGAAVGETRRGYRCARWIERMLRGRHVA